MTDYQTTLEGQLTCLSVNRDCSQVVVAGRNVFKIFNIEDNRFEERMNLRVGKNINLNYSASDVVWNQIDDHILASAATNGAVVTWNLNRSSKQKQDMVYTEHKMSISRVCFHPKEPHLLLSCSRDGYMKLFDLRSKHVSATFNGNSQAIRDVQFSKSSDDYFAAACDNGNIQIWDYRMPNHHEGLFAGHTDPVFCIDWHFENRNMLASCSRDKTIKVWDVSQSNRPKQIHSITTIASVSRIRWRPQYPFHIASCAFVIDSSINVWDVRRPYIPLATFNEHTDVVTGVTWKKSDSNVLLSSGKDGILHKHMFRNAKRPVESANPVAVNINMNGTILQACMDKSPQMLNKRDQYQYTKSPSTFRHQADPNEQFNAVTSSLMEHTNELEDLDVSWIKDSALGYKLTGKSLADLCDHNAEVANKLGRVQVMQTWLMVKSLYNTHSSTPNAHCKVHNKTDAHKDTDPFRGKTSVLQDLSNKDSKVNDQTEDNSTGVSDEELDEVDTTPTPAMKRGINSSHDFFGEDQELDMASLDFVESHYEYNRPEDWMLSNEAFLPRHGLEDGSGINDHLPNDSASSDTDRGGTLARINDTKMAAAETNIKEELLSIPPFTATLPNWSFNKQIIDMLKYHAQMGDVQTAVSILIVLGDKIRPLIDELTLEQWYTSYIDFLGRFKLWTKATEIIKLSNVSNITIMNTNSTTIYLHCGKCGKKLPLGKSGWLCAECKHIKSCSICQRPVKGLYVWCQGCSHGGHLQHMKRWFETNKQCPVGCGHLCEYM